MVLPSFVTRSRRLALAQLMARSSGRVVRTRLLACPLVMVLTHLMARALDLALTRRVARSRPLGIPALTGSLPDNWHSHPLWLRGTRRVAGFCPARSG